MIEVKIKLLMFEIQLLPGTNSTAITYFASGYLKGVSDSNTLQMWVFLSLWNYVNFQFKWMLACVFHRED